MVKKIIIGLFATFYLAISSGFTVHLHYCMNKLAGWGLFRLEKDRCGVCGMHKGDGKGCCKDESKVVKFVKDQKLSDSHSMKIPSLGQPLAPFIIPAYTGNLPGDGSRQHYSLPPPFLRSVPLFIRNESFRI